MNLRLLTVNLLMDGAGPEALVRLLDEVDPDVVCAQELDERCAEVLAARLPHHRLRPELDFTGRGVASRVSGEFGDVEMPLRPGTSLRLEGVSILGVHMANPIVYPWWSQVNARIGQAKAVEDWLGSFNGPAVVAGDLNASPRWPLYRRLRANLSDLVLEGDSADIGSAEPTWGWRPGWPAMLRIDHVLGRQVRPDAVTTHTVEGSDHRAVCVDVIVG